MISVGANDPSTRLTIPSTSRSSHFHLVPPRCRDGSTLLRSWVLPIVRRIYALTLALGLVWQERWTEMINSSDRDRQE
ncbi:hypothetical protein ARMGADRAFT_501408 [Armillaria gallica]|uniref:Uncharacterized protein n=1 Tax=Armillaria gallica TaxID=47427 RepID=A0A2H3EJP1_ARMGA|nr:hypothetical protein ARMGADRAFT_501408 [Armillaria gallica]